MHSTLRDALHSEIIHCDKIDVKNILFIESEWYISCDFPKLFDFLNNNHKSTQYVHQHSQRLKLILRESLFYISSIINMYLYISL